MHAGLYCPQLIRSQTVHVLRALEWGCAVAGMAKLPDSDAWLIFDGLGRVFEVPNDPNTTQATLVVDLSDIVGHTYQTERSFQYLALSPDYHITKCFYASYNRAPENCNGGCYYDLQVRLRASIC
jgi:hypothetical protein